MDAPFERNRARRWPRLAAPTIAVVFAGGVAGGSARYAVSQAWPMRTYAFPWATFVVNTAGSFALPLLLVAVAEVWAPRRYARPLLATGFLGAFTTFSAVVVPTDQLAAHGHGATASIYLSASLFAALASAASGLLLGRSISASRHRHSDVGTPRRR